MAMALALSSLGVGMGDMAAGGLPAFDFNNPKFGLDFTTDTYIGGIQPDNALLTNAQDGRFMRQQLTRSTGASPAVPLHTPLADGTLRRYTGTQSFNRISTKGIILEVARTNRVLQSNALHITHQLTVTGGSGTFIDGETIVATGGGTGKYTTGSSASSNYFGTVTGSLICVDNGTGTFTGTLTGLTSAATKTISSTVVVWTASNCTVAANTTCRDGVTNSATTVTATADGGTVTQAITTTSAARYGHIEVKGLSGSGTFEYSIDGAAFTSLAYTNAWGRFKIATPRTSTTYTIVIRLGTSGDSFAVAFVECANTGGIDMTPTFTRTAVVLQERDRPSTGINGSINSETNPSSGMLDFIEASSQYGIYVEFATHVASSATLRVVWGLNLYLSTADKFRFSSDNNAHNIETANAAVISADYTQSSVNKAFGFVNGTAARLCANGGTVVSNATGFGPFTTLDHADFGTNGAGTQNLIGCIKKIKLWDFTVMQRPTDGQLQSNTA